MLYHRYMKRSRIGLVVVGSLILNTMLMLQPAGIQEVEAAFSGYNGRIAFETNRDGNSEIYMMNEDGSDPRRLTNNSSMDTAPTWSPDGSKIAFVSNRDGSNEIYVMDSDGSNQQRLTSDAYSNSSPSWSPSGDRVAFTSNAEGGSQIFTIDTNGNGRSQITSGPASKYNISWHPGGQSLIYQGSLAGNNDVWTVSIGDSLEENITNTPSSGEQIPRWSPDGQRIVFTSNRDGNNEIYTMNADGGDWVRITNDPANDNGAYWSPDGNKIVYHTDIPNLNLDKNIVVSNSSGTTKEITTTNPTNDLNPQWQPIPNTSPVLAAAALSVQSGSAQSVDVLTGATDEEALEAANVSLVSQPAYGTAGVELGKVVYTASTAYVGSDSLQYQVCDSFMLDQKCSTQTLGITVTPWLSLKEVGTVATDGSGKVISPSSKPTFSGYTTPLAEVKVEIHSDPIILTTQANGDGYWSVTPTSPLPSGDHTVYISSTLNGQTTQLDSFVLSVQTTTPNTGADYTLVRGVGAGLVGLGALILAAALRRRGPKVSPLSL